jgi:hypothetical protein
VDVETNHVFPADMAPQIARHGCGGTSDELSCFRCTTHKDARWLVLGWKTLPEREERWSLAEAAAHLRLHVPDLMYLNSQTGAAEDQLQENHEGFVQPQFVTLKRQKPKLGESVEAQQALEKVNAEKNAAELETARGCKADSTTFLVHISAYLQSPAELLKAKKTVPAGHDRTQWCVCDRCSFLSHFKMCGFVQYSMNHVVKDDCALQVPHIKFFPCSLHGNMHTVEKLTRPIQQKVVEELGGKGVAQFNEHMKNINLGWLIKSTGDKDAAKQQWKLPKMNGGAAVRCCEVAGVMVDWIYMHYQLLSKSAAADKTRVMELCQAYSIVAYTCLDMTPSVQ